MKGKGTLPMVGIIGFIALLAIATNPGILTNINLGSTSGCNVLLPQYANYECLEGAGDKRTYTDSDGYGCNIGVHCVDDYCDYSNMNPISDCIITSEVDALFIQVSGRPSQQLNYGQSVVVTAGELFKTSRIGGGIKFRSEYDNIYLRYENTVTGRVDTADGCDLSSQDIPYEQTRYLPRGTNKKMTVGESENYIAGFEAFPIYGNTLNYQGKLAICERKADTTAIIYEAENIVTDGAGCFFYPGQIMDYVDCCPGTTFQGVTCNDNFEFVSVDEPVNVGCCRNGICTAVNCPGQGGWYYVGYDAYKYDCTDYGDCVIIDEKSIECYYDSDCSSGLSCDRGTNKCVDKVVPVSCTSTGHDCCADGMFASNVELRSCQEAGFDDDYVCVNGFCVKDEIAASGGCQWWDIVCHVNNFWNWLVSALTGFFATLGVVALIVIVIFVGFMVLKK